MSQATTFFKFLLTQPVGIASNVLKMLNFCTLFSWYTYSSMKRKRKLGDKTVYPYIKKVHEFPVSSRDVTNQTPPGQE